jgi:hypothetical protein
MVGHTGPNPHDRKHASGEARGISSWAESRCYGGETQEIGDDLTSQIARL